MNYTTQLEFFRKILSNYHIDSHIMIRNGSALPRIDRGIRQYLNIEIKYEDIFEAIDKKAEENTIYKFQDEFFCNYFLLLLPETEKKQILICGPYLIEEFSEEKALEISEKFSIPVKTSSQFEKYFSNIPMVADDSFIVTLFNSLGEALWGSLDNFSVKYHDQLFTELPSDLTINTIEPNEGNSVLAIEAIEKRYEEEEKLLNAIGMGLEHKAEQFLRNSLTMIYEKRVDDPIRNTKNFLIVFNTLCRKTVQKSGVHPYYIDRLSSDLGKKIEEIKSTKEVGAFVIELAGKYCALVNSSKNSKFSLQIQKAITVIDYDLSADLSLKSLSKTLNINASYLSALFKRETGETLTSYITKQRIEYAKVLLASTNLQIQTIAQYCGILDVNYFSKTFKKHCGKSPSKYRNERK